MGTAGSTSSTNSAALSAMRLAPQLGQKPRRLQLKATRRSCLQHHSARAKSRAQDDRSGEIPQPPAENRQAACAPERRVGHKIRGNGFLRADRAMFRSEEHTSELQSQSNLVCPLLL